MLSMLRCVLLVVGQDGGVSAQDAWAGGLLDLVLFSEAVIIG